MSKRPPFHSAAFVIAVALAVATPRVAAAATLDHGVFPIDTSGNPYLPTQQLPAGATDGSKFLVVWQDGRDSSGGGDVYGVLMDTAGTALTPGGFPVVHDTFAQTAPAAAYGGDSTYLVVWTDKRADAAGDVYGARLSRAGQVLDPNGIRICVAAGAQSEAAVAAGDSCWLVTWTDSRQGKDIIGARVSWSGELLDTAGIPIAANYGEQTQSAVASGTDGFYVAWLNVADGDSALYGARVAASGFVLGPPARIAGDLPRGIAPVEPALAFDGSNYLAVWCSRTYLNGVYGRFVSRAGVVGDSTVRITSHWARRPRIVFDGACYVVCWAEFGSGEDIYGTRVTPGGAVSPDPVAIVVAEYRQGDVAVTADGRQCLVVWTDERMDYTRYVAGTIVDSAMRATRSEMLVSQFASAWEYRCRARVCADTGGYYLACVAGEPRRQTYCPSNVVALRLDRSGTQLDDRMVGLGFHTGVQDSAPVVAAGDSVYLTLYWWGARPVTGIRVSRTGEVLDPAGFPVFSFASTQIDVCSGSGRFLAVGANGGAIYGALISEAGQIISPGVFPISTGTSLGYPSVTFDGTNFLVTWCDYQAYVYSERVDTLGNVLGPVAHLGSARTNTGGADVAFGDSVYLAVWAHYANVWYVKGILIGADGYARGSVMTISDTAVYDGSDAAPRVCFDGRDFVVTWASRDYYSDSTYVAGALVTQGGATTRRFSIVTRSQRPEDITPDAACGPEGRVLIAYTDICDQPGPLLGKYRIYGCFLDSLLAVSERGGASRTEASFAASPNPFTRSVRIRVPTPAARGSGTVALLNAAGRVVRTIPRASRQEVVWDGCDALGRAVPPGVYFCRYDGTSAAVSLKLVRVE
jgi:hypothetical protein